MLTLIGVQIIMPYQSHSRVLRHYRYSANISVSGLMYYYAPSFLLLDHFLMIRRVYITIRVMEYLS